MRISSIQNTSFGKLRIKHDPINVSYLNGFVGDDKELLSALNVSLTNINAKTGKKYVDFRINLEKDNADNTGSDDVWALRVTDAMDAGTLSEMQIKRNAPKEEYIEALKQLAISTPRYDSVMNTRELLNKFQ